MHAARRAGSLLREEANISTKQNPSHPEVYDIDDRLSFVLLRFRWVEYTAVELHV